MFRFNSNLESISAASEYLKSVYGIKDSPSSIVKDLNAVTFVNGVWFLNLDVLDYFVESNIQGVSA